MTIARVALLTVGDEILGGKTLNTNAAFLGERLTEAGFTVVATETVGDDEFAIADAAKGLCARAEAVIVAGGLGPTPDDVTREGLAGAAGKLLVVDDRLRRRIARRTKGRAPRRNARMARIPEGAQPLDNPIGAASGLRLEIGGTPVYALPGVPMELEAIFERCVLPDLQARFGDLGPVPTRVLRVFGLREAEVAGRLGRLLERGRGPLVGVTVRDGVITITVRGPGAARRADAIRAKLGRYVFAEGERTLAGVVVAHLAERGETLACAESITGGMLASLVVGEPGASRVFLGGIVAYTGAAKRELLAVARTVLERKGPVSPETAVRMARGARRRLGADWALAATGAAGPDPADGTIPPGEGYVARVGPHRTDEKVAACHFHGTRDAIRRRFALTALDLLRRRLESGRGAG